MWFKKSFIPLSAVVILTALSSENYLANYLASSIFFILSWNERMKENDEDNRIRRRRIQDEWEENKRRRPGLKILNKFLFGINV